MWKSLVPPTLTLATLVTFKKPSAASARQDADNSRSGFKIILTMYFHDNSCLDGRDDPCLDGREPSSEVDDLTLALSHLSTSTNSASNHPVNLPGAPVTPARGSAQRFAAIEAALTSVMTNLTPAGQLAARTASVASTSTNSTLLGHPLTARTVPATVAVVFHGRRKYYVVVVGKCAGIYYDLWDNVELLIRYVSDARHKSFPTFERAVAYYLDAKRRNLVRIVRDPGDDYLYGPINDAVQ